MIGGRWTQIIQEICSLKEEIWVYTKFKIKCRRTLRRGVIRFFKFYKKHFHLTCEEKFGEGKGKRREKSIMKNSTVFSQLFGIWKYFEVSFQYYSSPLRFLFEAVTLKLLFNLCRVYPICLFSIDGFQKCMSIKYKNVKL